MKKVILFLISIICLCACIDIMSACNDKESQQYIDRLHKSNAANKNHSNNLDSLYVVTPVTKTYPDGSVHDYYLYESGLKGGRNYSFTIEHRIDCKACYAIFD